MYSVSIARPVEGINTIAFEIPNDSAEDKQFYIEDMTIQSFLRNVDWTTNCFSWIEARRLTQSNVKTYYVTDGAGVPSNTYVYVFCCLRLTPGTYSNIESVLNEINNHLRGTVDSQEKQNGMTVKVRDIPCSLYNIAPNYDSIASYKIDGFTVGLIPDSSSYMYTTDGYEATTRIAPAILKPDLYSVWRQGTNKNTRLPISNPYIPPVIHLDIANNTYSTNYPTFDQHYAQYNSAVASVYDLPDSLNRHAIDFNTGITNHLGLTPYVLPIEHLFTYDGEPIIHYSNGTNYSEYLIDPTKADLETIQSFYINTIAANFTIQGRSSNKSCSWMAPIVLSKENKIHHIFNVAINGLKENDTYMEDEIYPFGKRIIVNEETNPASIILRQYQLYADTVSPEFRNSIADLLNSLVGEEIPLEPVEGETLTYSANVETGVTRLTVTIWFTEGTTHIKENINAKIEMTDLTTGEISDITELVPGLLVEGGYKLSDYMGNIIPSLDKNKLSVVDRLDATKSTQVLAIYTNKAYLNKIGTILNDNKTLIVNQHNITKNAMYDDPLSVSVKMSDSLFQYEVDNNVESDEQRNATIDLHFTFTNAVMFTLNGNNYDLTLDAGFANPGRPTTLFTFDGTTRWKPYEVTCWEEKTGPHGITGHDHYRAAILKGVTITLRKSCKLVPTNYMMSIYDPNEPTGHRVYRKFMLLMYDYDTPDPGYRYTIQFMCNDYCSHHETRDWPSGFDPGWYQGCPHYEDDGNGCSDITCGGPVSFTIWWGQVKDPANRAYSIAVQEFASKKPLNQGIPIYIAYKEVDGKFVYDKIDESDNEELWYVPYRDYESAINELYNFLSSDIGMSENDKQARITAVKKRMRPIYPLGPYIDPNDTEPPGEFGFKDMGEDNKIIHTNSWLGYRGYTAILDNDNTTDSSVSLSNYLTGNGMDSNATIPILQREITNILLSELYKYNLEFRTTSAPPNYIVTLRKNTDLGGSNIIPINSIFTKACSVCDCCFILNAVQALAYASIPVYDPSMDTELFKERSIDLRGATLNPGDVIINGNIYMMDRNNDADDDVNSVKYYPFFAFSNKLYVYMLSDPNVDQLIESQLLNVRTIRSSLAEIDISSNYGTVTTVAQPGSVIRFANANKIPIEYTNDTGYGDNILEMSINANSLNMTPINGINSLNMSLATNQNIPINVTIDSIPTNTEEGNTTSMPIAYGKVSLTGLTLSQLNTKVITSDIYTTDNLTGNINMTIPGSSGLISAEYFDSVPVEDQPTQTVAVSEPSGTLNGIISTNSQNINSGFIASLTSGSMYSNLSMIDLEPLPKATREEGDDSNDIGKIDDTELIEYGRGNIQLDGLNMKVGAEIPSTAIGSINGTLETVDYHNSKPIVLRGNAPVPVSMDMSSVIGNIDSDGTYLETERLNYQVSISPYTIPIHKTILVEGNSSKYIYITGNLHKYPIWESTHSLVYKAV